MTHEPKTITLTAGDEITLRLSPTSPAILAEIDGLFVVLTAPQARAVSEELRRLADEIEGAPDGEKEAEAYLSGIPEFFVRKAWALGRDAFLAGWRAGRK